MKRAFFMSRLHRQCDFSACQFRFNKNEQIGFFLPFSLLGFAFPGVQGEQSGTSFAAPMVTGGVILLMGSYPYLRDHTELVLPLLMNSASSISGEECLYSPYCGGGLFNCEAALNIMASSYYRCFSASTFSQNSILDETQVLIPAGKVVDLVLGHLYRPNFGNPVLTDEVRTPNPNQYRLTATSSDGITTTFDPQGNITQGTLFNSTSLTKTYTIRTIANGTNVENAGDQKFGLTWNVVDHVCHHDDHYVSSGTVNHRAYCPCGNFVSQAHAFGAPRMVLGQLYITCSRCGQMMKASNLPPVSYD